MVCEEGDYFERTWEPRHLSRYASFFRAEGAAFRGSTGGYCAPALPAVGAAGPAQLASSSGYRVLSFDHTEGCLQLEECAGCRKFHTDGVDRLAWCRGLSLIHI